MKLRALALATYGRGGSSPAYPRVCTSGGTSEHKDGRAWDWMLNVGNRADRKVSADFLGWLTGAGPTGIRGEMAARLGVMYVIYNHKSWSSYNRVWKDYTGDDPHTSHIHISLSWNGARATTSFWTGRVWSTDYGPCRVFTSQPAVVPTAIARTRPCGPAVLSPRGSSLPFGWIGSTGAAVSLAQRTLGTAPTGRFDATTRAAVLRYQRTHDLPRTGTLDKPTWASLRPLSLRLNVPDWRAGEALDWALSRGTVPSLHRASAGTAVYALQVALKLPPAWRTGFFGARTAAAVVAVKRAVGLPATVVVNAAVWQGIADSR
ncbi:MAG: peptidoglycan-binding protein [Propionibacteriales bacterium]|nr:peptidoglycan-binding protein [Propionibacteriales bacterium]